MKIFCNYHPTKLAQWNCPRCEANYCASCVTKRTIQSYSQKDSMHFCTKCDLPAQRLSIANTIIPFWNRLPRFFIYSLHPRPLLLMIVLSFATLLFSNPTLFSTLMRGVIGVIILKYAHAALKTTSEGTLTPPKVDGQTTFGDGGVVFKQFCLFIVIGIAFTMVLQKTGIFVGIAFLSFIILSIPAMIIVLVVSGSLLQAMNPMNFARMAWRIGWGYLLMYLFLTFLGSAPAVLGRYILVYFPPNLYPLLFTMAQSFYTITSFHLMGYVLFQYHEEIGYKVYLEDEDISSQDMISEQGTDNETLKRVNILVKEGKIDEAIFMMREEAGDALSSDLALAQRYYNLLKIKQLVQEMLDHGRAYLDLLAKTDQKDKLCEVYSECASKDTGFKPSPSTLMRIASCCKEAGKNKEAIEAYNRFIKTNPKNPLIPKAYFLAANIINEKFENPQKAAGILNGLIKSYPEHEIIPFVQGYLREIKLPS